MRFEPYIGYWIASTNQDQCHFPPGNKGRGAVAQLQ